MVMQGCYTEKELREIQAGARRYDEMSDRQQIRDEGRLANAQRRATPSMRWAVEIYELLGMENIGFISDTHREIGALRAVKERFPGNNTIQQWCDYHIRCALCEIEGLTDEVKYDRETARELARV